MSNFISQKNLGCNIIYAIKNCLDQPKFGLIRTGNLVWINFGLKQNNSD